MKILALRGQNIASLSAPFHVDLTAGLLGDSGLFAIAGPTGAGKSTLLDAMCLALFDRTPRLQDRGGVHVGRADQTEKDRIRANDVRGLLSRGAGQGFAEVDFRGSDGHTYRARWEVRRARNKAHGRLQDQTMSLTRVSDDKRIGDKKTEVLAAIEGRLGLTFDQFKRSAMLAQGDFAAFLHADEANRADLLERVTGTQIYSDISRESHRRTAQERAAYQALEQQAASLGRLTPEQREALEEDLKQRAAHLEEAETANREVERQVGWFTERNKLATRVQQGREAAATAQSAVTTAQPRRQHLQRVIAMAPVRLPLEARNATRDRRDTVREEHQVATQALRTAQATLQTSQTQRHTASETLKTAQDRAAALAPHITQATELDARLGDARKAVKTAQATLDTAVAQVQAATSLRQELAQQVSDAQARAQVSREWVAAHPHAQRLASNLEAVHRALATLTATQQVLTHHAEQHAALEQASHQATADHTQAVEREKKALAETVSLEQALQQARSAIAPNARDALEQRRTALQERTQAVQRLTEAVSLAKRAHEQRVALKAEQVTLAQTEAKARDTLTDSQKQLEQDSITLVEAERHLDGLRQALSADELRHSLVDGEPCVVCGATEHPWAADGVVGELHTKARERVDELKKSLSDHRQTAAQASARLEATARDHERLARTDAEITASHTQAVQLWHAADTVSADLPATVPTDAQVLAPHVETNEREQAEITAESEALRVRERAVSTAQASAEASRTAYEGHRAARETAQQAARGAADAVEASTRAAQQAQREQATAIEALSDALGPREGWREDAIAKPEAVQQTLSEEAATWRTHHAVLEQTDALLKTSEPKLVEATATVSALERQKGERDQEVAQATKALSRLSAERAKLLDGRDVAAVQAELRKATTSADAALSKAETAYASAEKATSAADATAAALAKQLAEAAAAATAAQEALETALRERDVDEATASTLLAQPISWVEEETAALAALDRAVEQANTVVDERVASLSDHEQTAPDIDEPTAKEQLQTAQAHVKAARDEHSDTRARLRQDDHARKEGAALDRALADQHAIVQQWAAISDVIGSASGKVFQTFAQGLTLDALLRHANHHLRDLAPRYRLQRVPGADLALQVLDQDMGDEVRSVPSLSGGETFLTSLALALGLSSLSASDTPVESLFIDEGFGTLDRDTLETALAALDALQASGRQVGLISHVDGLSEHIGVAIRIDKLGAGKSRVVVPERMAAP